MTRHRREVAGNDYLVPGFIATDKDKYRPFVIIDNQPLKAVRVKIQFVQRLMMTIGMVQIAHQTLHPVMPVVVPFQQMPVEAGVVVPLPSLGEFIAHKQQFFPREGEHPAVVGAQVGELLPGIAGHAVKKRFFTVDHFIMRQRQDEVFGVVVEYPEGHLVVMMPTMDRVELHIVEGVVHPAEVPFEPEAEAARRRRA